MRQARKIQEGARYHVIARVNNKELLLRDKSAKELFEQVLMQAKAVYAFTIENFVIMGNHYHLIIRPHPGENLSRIMQWIMSVFAMKMNRQLGRSGHFWGSRFFSRILSALKEYLQVYKYIDDNPVVSGLAVHITDWQFCGINHHRCGLRHITEQPPAFLLMVFPAHCQFMISG